MDIRRYDEARDLEAVQRVWNEVGWLRSRTAPGAMRDLLRSGSCRVACLDGTAECMVHTVPGSIRHLERSLSLCAVTAVTTSRVARRQGFARRLTALQLAEAAEAGTEVAALGMFDQGFYDRIGFGTGAYEHRFVFDPATLNVDAEFRVPTRLGREDWRDMHRSMTSRLKNHGAVTLDPPEVVKAETGFAPNGLGLGYYDGDELTHFIWFDVRGEHGPYVILACAYRTLEQLEELFALIKSLGDQVASVQIIEPPHVQLQCLLKYPLRTRRITDRSEHGNQHRAEAWWQVRLLDIASVKHVVWPGEPLRFNLELSDPIEAELSGQGWRGIGGTYTVELGRASRVTLGSDADLSTLTASVNAFSRLFFGVASASALTVTDSFRAPAELLGRLDEVFRLPAPQFGWDF